MEHLTLFSDHKPLEHLLSECQQVPPMASARIQHWSLTLSAYKYAIKHRAGIQMANSDALSLPVFKHPKLFHYQETCSHFLNHLTDKDAVLSRVRRLVQTGWTVKSSSVDLAPPSHAELGVLDGCLLWGSRVIVPMARHHIVR